MPYANIHFVKLQLKLLTDERWKDQCNDSQKLLYTGLLLLAGATRNQVPNNENYVKRELNLAEKTEKVRENIDHLLKVFPNFRTYGKYLKFTKFSKLHNPLRPADGFPSDTQRTRTVEVQKITVDRIRIRYIELKGWEIESLPSEMYARTAKAIKRLITLAYGEDKKVIISLHWIDKFAKKQNWADWTLETLIKRWPDFIKSQNYIKQIEKKIDRNGEERKRLEKEKAEHPEKFGPTPEQLAELEKVRAKIGK